MMYQTSDNCQLLRRILWINAQLTIVWSLKHHSIQPIYIFNWENPQNSEPQNSPRRGLDFIALVEYDGFQGLSKSSLLVLVSFARITLFVWFIILKFELSYLTSTSSVHLGLNSQIVRKNFLSSWWLSYWLLIPGIKYSCNKIATTWIQIYRQNWNAFFSNASHQIMI